MLEIKLIGISKEGPDASHYQIQIPVICTVSSAIIFPNIPFHIKKILMLYTLNVFSTFLMQLIIHIILQPGYVTT